MHQPVGAWVLFLLQDVQIFVKKQCVAPGKQYAVVEEIGLHEHVINLFLMGNLHSYNGYIAADREDL